MFNELSELFVKGGSEYMSILTLLLALLFLAAWKAPAWVRDIGNIALAFGILIHFMGIYQAFGDLIAFEGDVSIRVIYAGYRCASITVMYGFIIYIVARIIHIFQTPRI